ncbi:MAG: Ig-like domain-containing protein [bacterium]
MANYPVDWMVTEGNGKLTAYRSLTGLNGQAQTFLILGNQGPTNKVEVRAALPGTLPAFTATTLSGIATAASIVSGNAQSAAVRTALLNLLVVKVADGNGGGVANYPVEFVSIRGGGTASAVNRVANPGFESVVNGTTVPGIWKLEGTPSVAEVSGSTDGPRSGSRSLNVTATRSGVGVSQTITYPANSSFTLSFYAKVISGTARVTWQMAQDQTIDMTAASTKSAWQFYTIYASSGATAGAKTLSFKTNGTGNFFIDDIKILPNTGANGQASITWTMGDTAMVQQGRVNVLNGANGNLTGAPLNFSATARAGPAAAVKKQSGDNQAGAASQPLPVPFVAKVSDVTGINGVTNVDVTFEVTAGGKLPGNLTKQTVKSDASGLASTTLTLGPQTGVPNTVKVSIPNVTQTETFTAIAAVPGRIAKGASAPTFGSAGKKMATALTVQVFDTDNKRVAGFPVTFTVKSGGGSINGGASAVIPTDINGEAKAFPVLGPNPGAANRIEASVTHNNAPVTNSPLVFIVTAVRLKTITLVSGNNQPGGVVSTALPQPLKVKLADSLGAGIKDQNVIFTVAAGNGKVNGVTPATVKTDSAGVASATWTLGPTPGTNNNRVQATTNPALTGAPIIFQASAVAGQASNLAKVSRDSASSVVNGTMPLTVKTVDVGGNPKADVNVVFTVKSGGGKVNGTASATVKSQANGQATVTLTLGPTSGAFVNVIEASAQFNNKPLTGSPITYRITGTSSKAASLASASGNRQTGQAGEKLPKQITIKVIDGSNNGVVNHPVTFRISRGEGHFGTPNVTEILVQSDATGFAKANWHLGPATKPDSQIVMAISTDGVNNLRNVPFRFVAFANPGPPNAEASFVQAIPSTITADGVARSQVKVYVRDRYGNGIKGATVTIDVSGEGTRVTQPAMPTDANGVAEGSFTSTRAENKNVTARVISATPIDVTRGANVRVTPLTAQSLIQGGGNGQTGNVNTSLPAPLVVKVGDRFGNGVPGYEVRYKVEQGGGKVQDPASGELLDSLRIRTDEEGFVRVSYVCGSTTTENQIRVLANGLSNSPFLFLAQVRNAPAAKLELGGGNNQVGTVGAMLAKPIAVKVLDNNNRPVSGVPVRFSISLGNGAINEQSIFIVASDAFGEAKVAWRLGPEAGLNVLRAEAPGLANSPIDFQAEASPDRAAAIRFVGNNPVFGNVNGQSEPLTVQAVDVLNNGVAGIGVIFELVEGTGRLTENYVVTGDGGYAAVRAIFDAKSGPRKVRVSSEGLLGSPIIVIAYAQPSGAVSIEAVPRSNNQSGTKGIPVNFPLQVKVFDDLNNPVPGVQVQFVVTLGGGNFGGNGFTNAVSDSAGIASAMWTLGNSAGPNQAKANKNGLAGSPVTFNATAVDNNFPVIADVEDVRSRENDVIRFSVSATDADGDPFTYSALSVPSGASFDVQTRTFTWQTGLSSAGHYEVSFLARDNRGGVDEEVVSIDIANLNQPPFIQRQVPADRGFTTPDTVINNGNVAGKFMMHVFAIDSDQDKLSYRWYRDGIFTGVFGNSYEFVYNAVTLSSFYNVEVLVFDAADTVRVTWLIKVPVELSSFSAAVVENQRVLLSWKTETEQDNAGFNVLRSPAKQGKYEKLNAKLIPARRDGEYEFIDEQIDAGGKYYYKLESVDLTGRGQLHGPVMVEMSAPQSFVLNQNYPNPFNPSTHIRFELPKAAPITLSVYNSLGQEVRRLVNTQKPAGYHTVVWNGRDQQGKLLPSGIYHYRIQAGDFVATKKMVLAK